MRFDSKTGSFQSPEVHFICAFGIGEAIGIGALVGGSAAAGTAATAGGVLAGEVVTTAAATGLGLADAAAIGGTALGAAGAAGAFSGGTAAAAPYGGEVAPLTSPTLPGVTPNTSLTAPGGTPTTASLTSPGGTPFGSPTSGGVSAAGSAPPAGAGASPDLASPITAQTLPQVSAGGTDVGGGATSSIGKAIANPGFGTIGHAVAENASPLIAGVGLANNLLQPNTLPYSGQLTGQAAQLGAQGNQLESYLTSGTLPPGVKSAIDTATKSAQASIRSKYASMGMSGSTAETQELSQALLNSQNQGSSIAMQLLQTGINEVGLSNGIYESLMNATNQQNTQTGQAIANLAGALGGGTKVGGLTITQNG